MIEKYKRGGVGFILVKLDAVYKKSNGILGVDGKEIILGDPDYNKEKNANTSGTVIQIPVALGKHPISSERSGWPAYGAIRLPEADINISDAIYSRAQNKIKFRNDIKADVQVGDKVYFQWQAVFDRRHLIAQAPDKSSFIFKVNYDLVYAVVRDGKIIPIGSNILIDPVFETWENTFKKTYYPYNDRTGKPMVRPKKDWIQIKVAPKHVEREGVIKHIGSPLRGEKCVLKEGMKVLYKPKLQNLLDVEGNKYFIIRQNQIILYKN